MTRSTTRWLALVAFAAGFYLLGPLTPAKADIIVDPNNTGATDVDPAYPSNWPGGAVVAFIGKTAAGEIEVNGGTELRSLAVYIGFQSMSTGKLSVAGSGTSWINEWTLWLGRHGSGMLMVTDGGTVSISSTSIGDSADSTGVAIIDGAGSTWTSSNSIDVGCSGNGTLTITNGAVVSNHSTDIGQDSSSTGLVTVNGEGSTWTNSGFLFVGCSGNGTLEITDGASVDVSNYGVIGKNLGSMGRVSVDGTGSSLRTNRSFLRVGDSGNGTLTITNGGSVSVDGYTYVAYQPGSTGMIDFGANGGTLTTDSIYVSASQLSGSGTINSKGIVSDIDLVFDSSQSGVHTVIVDNEPSQYITINLDWSNGLKDLGVSNSSLTIQEGVSIASGKGYLGYSSGSTGTATIDGTGSTWNSSYLFVGYDGNGTLAITNSASVVSYDSVIANHSDTTCQVTVDGIGSAWNNRNNLEVGGYGNGSLSITNGGSVSNNEDGSVGHQLDSTGMVTVDGNGSNWTIGNKLHVGYYGNGALTITDGGTISNHYGYIGNYSGSMGTVIVDGPGSTWINDNALKVGVAGNAILSITNGGAVSNYFGFLSNSVVTVDGVGSTWTNNNDLFVGFYGDGSISVINGGAVNVSYDVYIGDQLDMTGAVLVNGEGSTWTCRYGDLYVGHDGAGKLGVSSGGSVSGKNISINDQSLLAIEVSAGSLLNANNGSGTLENNGTVRILAGVVPAAGAVYSPIAAGTWEGTGVYQAVGGTWDDVNHEFTASPVIQAGSGQRLAFDRSVIQRVKFDDAATGWTVGASFLAAETSTAIDLTVTAVDGTVLADLADHLDPGDAVLGAWDFDIVTGFTSGDPAYLSFEVGSGYSRDDLEVWHYDGAAWRQFEAWNLTYDGTYASFTVDELSSYAVAPLKETWIPGDCDGDNRVDEDDAATLAGNWGKEGGWADGDFNDDGWVNAEDASILAAHWGDWTTGDGQSNNSVPEPGAVVMLIGLGLFSLRRVSR